MNRILLCLLCLWLTLHCCTASAEVELSNRNRVYLGASTIILNIPAVHTLTLQCGEHGCVMVDGLVYRGLSTLIVPRDSAAIITIIPQDGYYAETVTASDNTGVVVTGDSITVSKIDRDYTFVLSFAELLASSVTIQPADVVMAPGMDVTLQAITVPKGALVSWRIGDDSVADIDENGTIHAKEYGSTYVTVSSGDANDSASVSIRDLTTAVLPDALVTLGDGAMINNVAVENVVLSDRVTTIGNRTFSGCTNLRFIRIPSSVVSIGLDAFQGCDKLVILCDEGSVAHQYAQEHGICFSLVK